MEEISQNQTDKRDSISKHHENDGDDEGTRWSISSNGGISRSSYDDGFTFQNVSTHSDKLSDKHTNNEEYIELLNSMKINKYYYDGIEEICMNSDNEDDERIFNDQNRTSFTREQLIEYQQLIKLLRFIKSGGRCTTILSLALLQDHNLQDQCAFLAFKDSSTINILLNFIEMFDQDIKLNTLYVLKEACQNNLFAYELFRLGGIVTIIDSVCFDHIGIQEACLILLKLILFRRGRRVIRRCGAISKLISLLDELSENLNANNEKISDLCQVFLLLCKSEKNKYVAIRYGIRQVLLKIISNNSSTYVISLLSTLIQIPIFRMQMLNKELILTLINLIDLKNLELTRVICESLYYFSFDKNLCQFIYENGFKKLKDLLEKSNDPSIFSSIINILTEFIRNNETFSTELILNMIKFLKTSSDLFYLTRIIKSLNQLTKIPQTIKLFKQENIFPNLIHLLEEQINNNDIQLNILEIFQQTSKDKEAAKMIIDNNGLQQLWTLFKYGSIPIKISAGWAIKNCLKSIENHGELIRSYDGIFYLLLNTLSTDNIDLLSVTLSIIGEIVKDKDNLEILTDLGIVSKILQLKNLDNPKLSRSFSDALANLLNLRKNQEEFSNRYLMNTLKDYLKQNDQQILKSLTKAIYDLSFVPANCLILHEIGVAPDLLQFIGDDDPLVQEKSAYALRNMRLLFETNRQIERNLIKQIHKMPKEKKVDKRNKCLNLYDI